MRQPEFQWYRLRWPREVSTEALRDVCRLLATAGGAPLIIETLARGGQVEHRLGLPTRRAASATSQLRTAMPALDLSTLAGRESIDARQALSLRLTTPLRPLDTDSTELVSRAALTVLARARRSETLVLQWQLLAALPPLSVHSAGESAEPLPASVADVLLGRRGQLDAEGRRALRAKRELPVWRVLGRIAVRASTPAREHALLHELLATLRLANAPGVHLLTRRCSPVSVDRFGRSWFAPLRLNTAEVVALSGWPVGSTARLPVERVRSRPLAASTAIPSRGRVIGLSTVSGSERPLALAIEDGLRHLHVLGPTGVGKSTLLLNLIAQDVAAGRGVVVVESKGDLIAAVLERMPRERVGDVVLLDSSDAAPVGLNPLASSGRPPELVADELLLLFRRLYESSWGPRTNDILGASLLTLARTPGMTLCALPVLLTDAGFRRRVVSQLDDPVALEAFWLGFENWSEAERAAAIAPSLNRVRPFLMRPQLRAVLGQVAPRFDLAQVFTERKILLVNLAKGAMGAEAAALLGSLALSQLWAAAQRRATVAPSRRHPVFVYVDEFQDYLHLPTDLTNALAQARGLGIGFVLAHQHLGQLDSATRIGVLANAGSRVCFQLGADDARLLADHTLSAEDFRELGAFEIYAQLTAGNAVQPWCSARTMPAPAVISDAEEVRRCSRERYGVDRRLVDASIAELHAGRVDADDLTPRRRGNRGEL